MNFWWKGGASESSEDDMAKARGRAQRPIDGRLVAAYLDRLSKAGANRPAFDALVADLGGDASVSAGEMIAIAHAYIGGGKKPTSKKAALAAISKRFVEIVRFHAKNKIAEKARPW